MIIEYARYITSRGMRDRILSDVYAGFLALDRNQKFPKDGIYSGALVRAMTL